MVVATTTRAAAAADDLRGDGGIFSAIGNIGKKAVSTIGKQAMIKSEKRLAGKLLAKKGLKTLKKVLKSARKQKGALIKGLKKMIPPPRRIVKQLKKKIAKRAPPLKSLLGGPPSTSFLSPLSCRPHRHRQSAIMPGAAAITRLRQRQPLQKRRRKRRGGKKHWSRARRLQRMGLLSYSRI